MVVPFAPVTVQVLLHTNVERKQNLVFKAILNEFDNVASSYFICRITVPPVADVVNAKKHALLRNLPKVVRAKAVPEMADHDAVGRHTFFSKQSDLLQSQFAEMGGMGPDRHTSQPLGPR